MNYLKSRSLLMMIVIFFITFVIIVLRRPDILFNAQPWAEDGVVWMQFIHNNGFFSTIFEPQNGYYQTISKLAFGLGLSFGVEYAALTANVLAISLRCFMVMFLLSQRFKDINIWYKLALAVYFLLMPNIDEGYVNITNAHWYLSIYLMMVIVADNPKSKLGYVHDYLALIISALSGPFIVFIAPCLFLKRLIERGGFWNAIKGINSFDIIAAVLAFIQVVAILTTSDANRTSAPLGASFVLLSTIISYRVIIGAFFDNVNSSAVADLGLVNVICFLIFASIIILSFVKGSKNLRICLLFPVIMIGFSLAKPMMAANTEQWPIFLLPGAGQRYFIVTNTFFCAFILYIMHKLTNGSIKAAIIFILLPLPLYATYFKIYPLKDVSYKENIMKYYELKNGESINIPINPGWQFTLIKK